jgi:hypothetical protein
MSTTTTPTTTNSLPDPTADEIADELAHSRLHHGRVSLRLRWTATAGGLVAHWKLEPR